MQCQGRQEYHEANLCWEIYRNLLSEFEEKSGESTARCNALQWIYCRFFKCPAMALVDPAPWPLKRITQRKRDLFWTFFIPKSGQKDDLKKYKVKVQPGAVDRNAMQGEYKERHLSCTAAVAGLRGPRPILKAAAEIRSFFVVFFLFLFVDVFFTACQLTKPSTSISKTRG